LKMDFRVAAIPAPHGGGAGIRTVDQVLPFTDLIYLLLHGNHSELAESPDEFEALHVQGPEAGVVESLGHDSERVAHEHLVHLVAGEEVG
jgi:hypothetical protein